MAFLFVLAAFLVGCHATGAPETNQMKLYHYENNEYKYSIDVPIEALLSWKGQKPADGKQTGFATYPILMDRKIDDYDISISAGTFSCSIERTAILPYQIRMIKQIGLKTFWGPADTTIIQSKYDYVPEMGACRNIAKSAGGGAYGLCSTTSSGKSVLICISQMTDDPALAEQIFSTFRWLD